MKLYKNIKDYAEDKGIYRTTASKRIKEDPNIHEIPKGYKYISVND